MTAEQIRNARNSFAAQLTNMIRDFERQTGAKIKGIAVERTTNGAESFRNRIDQFKGVHVSIDS